MFLAIAVLLIQSPLVPKFALSADAAVVAGLPAVAGKIASVQPVDAGVSSSPLSSLPIVPSAVEEGTLPDAPAAVAITVQPNTDSDAAVPESAPGASSPSTPAAAIVLAKPYKNVTVSVDELRAENRRNQHLWLGLGVASHAAAGFDAWSTRRAITMSGGHEINPMLKPFAGNASIYAAIQVGPALMDYVGKKMMYSRHGWVRHMWWAPQSASFVTSLFCGAHNLGVQAPTN